MFALAEIERKRVSPSDLHKIIGAIRSLQECDRVLCECFGFDYFVEVFPSLNRIQMVSEYLLKKG